MAAKPKSTPPPRRKLRLYLAGPEVFLPDPVAAGRRKKQLCRQYGFAGVYPLDAEPIPRGLTKRAAGLRIGGLNEDLLRTCDAVIANLTPFRGPSADVGTVYEVGFARALGLLVMGYTNDPAPFRPRTLAWLGPSARRRKAEVRDADGLLVEDFDLMDNLMIESGIVGGGGQLIVRQSTPAERFTDLAGFELCLRELRRRVP